MFAWCLVNCLDKSRDEATDAALAFYAYEPAIDAYRGLVFHDEAWHWAMRRFVGEGYWRNRPDLAEPSAEYRAESLEFGKSRGA